MLGRGRRVIHGSLIVLESLVVGGRDRQLRLGRGECGRARDESADSRGIVATAAKYSFCAVPSSAATRPSVTAWPRS